MWPNEIKEKQKLQKTKSLLQKEKCEIIENLKKSVELWFLNQVDDEITFKEIQNSCLEIILHGLEDDITHQQQTNHIGSRKHDSSLSYADSCSDPDLYSANKIFEDFEWILNAVNIRNSTKRTIAAVSSTPPLPSLLNHQNVQNRSNKSLSPQSTTQSRTKQLKQWLRQNLKQANLCVFMQYLVTDKELLEEHYTSEALLRQEKYVEALLIGLSAFETHQYGLLTQIDVLLKVGNSDTQHKRSNSQPNVIVLPVKTIKDTQHLQAPSKTTTQRSSVLLAVRKTKSLPEFRADYNKDAKDMTESRPRPRCKTIAGIKRKQTKPRNIPEVRVHHHERNWSNILTISSGSSSYDDEQPSTSQNSKRLLSDLHLNSTASTTTSASISTSSSLNSNEKAARRIQLINTDDIKIWTDPSYNSKNKGQKNNSCISTPAQSIPSKRHLSTHKVSTSLSPLNSFFSSLFSTPPSYTSWYTEHNTSDETEIPETAIDTITSDFSHNVATLLQPNAPATLSTNVFDKFLPIYGKKLRSRNSQNLFDDVNMTLEFSTPASTVDITMMEGPATTCSENSTPRMKNCQSLTRFLQMSHLSRNNTELEKENAHFRVSEVIISAIEHIKWNKQEPQRNRLSREATPLATDCLSPSERQQAPTLINHFVEGEEHVPYAEEGPSDLLSAEVVGLSLISKFDEKHLPKVSELKWLVSDEDTPQKLLPMPDLTGSENPDEHVLHSVTRGTKYWAPPRQQIIFTDHPSPNRKDLLKKQNYRCAGCGMRVSQQYMQSFRYCTYLGKYHCTGCHRNQISATPAKILQSWDFKCYPVSVFSYRLLEQIFSYPLFYVPDLSPALYCRSKSLLSARTKRMQLKYVKDFIRMCRFAVREQTYFETIPDYITSDIDNWSMSDFVDAHSGCLHRSIDELIIKCENHIFNCVLCTARGFLCEYCNDDSVIYPWNSRVERCDRCGSCFHRNCWKALSELCCRCQRIDKRQEDDGTIHDA